MIPESYSAIIQAFKSLHIDHTKPLEVLRALIIKEYIVAHSDLSDNEISNELQSTEFQLYLHDYAVPAISTDCSKEFCEGMRQLHTLLTVPIQFMGYASNAFPTLLKSDYLFRISSPRYALSTYTLLYFLVQASLSCPDSKSINAEYYCDQIYFPNEKLLSSLHVYNLDEFLKCWQSLNYYHIRTEEMYVPQKLRKAMNFYVRHNIPYSVLLSQYIDIKRHAPSISKSIYPWKEWRRKTDQLQIESGMTRDETFFNDCALGLSDIRPTDIINGLFFRKRNDALAEVSILLNAVCLDIRPAKQILVVNPSPDFLVAYSQRNPTQTLDTTFVCIDDTVAAAYAVQFSGTNPYQFTSFEKLEALSTRYDYLIVIARDSALPTLAPVFSACEHDARLIAFLPQTMITGKGESVTDIFKAHDIYIDRILPLPSELSQSGKRKKFILHAKRTSVCPDNFTLLSTQYIQLGKLDHYTIVDPLIRTIPYEMLHKKRSLKQMHNHYDEKQRLSDDGHRKNATARIHSFSKEILLHYHLYQEHDHVYSARACYRSLIEDSNSRKLGKRLTAYVETGLRGSLLDITARLDELALSPDFEPIIAQEIEHFYNDHPETLTLKTVWYCNRETLRLSELTYDDEMAVCLFCGENQSLSNLVVGKATEDEILDALNHTLPHGENVEPKHHRLLKLIYRTAVIRGYLQVSPFSTGKSSMEQEVMVAMKQLRAALAKDFLSIEEIRRITDFLLEPVDKHQTPRAVKESCSLSSSSVESLESAVTLACFSFMTA